MQGVRARLRTGAQMLTSATRTSYGQVRVSPAAAGIGALGLAQMALSSRALALTVTARLHLPFRCAAYFLARAAGFALKLRHAWIWTLRLNEQGCRAFSLQLLKTRQNKWLRKFLQQNRNRLF